MKYARAAAAVLIAVALAAGGTTACKKDPCQSTAAPGAQCK